MDTTSGLFVGKVAIQKDILDKQLEEDNLSEKEKNGIQIALGMIDKRMGSEICHRVDKEEMPL